jgi:hypothetical protein
MLQKGSFLQQRGVPAFACIEILHPIARGSQN